MTKNVILIAEDDPDDQLMLQDAFEESALVGDLKFVKSGDEVLQYLEQKTHDFPSLIMLDLNMPKMDGRSLLKLLKSDSRMATTPIVILTTSKAETEQLNAFELGACDFFSKPSSFVELVRITTCILQKWLPKKSY